MKNPPGVLWTPGGTFYLSLSFLIKLDQLGQMLVTLLGGTPTASEGCGGDPVIYMLGANELPLRQGFACGKTLVRRSRAAPLCGAPRGRKYARTDYSAA